MVPTAGDSKTQTLHVEAQACGQLGSLAGCQVLCQRASCVEMIIELENARLRPLGPADAESLARHANDRLIWQNLRDAFPHPYSVADAQRYLERVTQGHAIVRGIEVDGAIVGAIGLHPKDDVYRHSAELGYWLGRPFQGRGIVTAAVRAMVPLGFAVPDLVRFEAGVFSSNLASARVLQKAGFRLEGVMRAAVFKDGRTLDQHLYALVKSEHA